MKSKSCLHSLSFLACFLRSPFASSSIPTTRVKRGGLRATQELPTVQCLYAKKAVSYSGGADEIIDQCIAIHDGTAHDLPKGMANDSTFASGQTNFNIHGATVTKDKHNLDRIEELEKARFEVFEPQGGRNLLGVTLTGDHKVLVVRVTSLDSQVDNSRSALGKLIFGDGVTLKGMYSACSFGKLNMLPFRGPGVVNGVAELFLNATVEGEHPQAIENLVMQQVHQEFGWEGVGFDHIMIMLPPGTASDWLAFSYIGAYRSVFNNDWSGYVSANVHEIGHTLGLYHSSRGENEYLDQTGFMGYSAQISGTPSKCFNGHKNYIFGWYSDRTLEIEPSSLPWTGDLVTFVDYDKAESNEPVLIKINDLYLQYNRAKSFNYQTRQNQDEVTITQGLNATSISTAVGSLSMSNTTFTVENYQGSESLLIEACSQQFVSDNIRVDSYRVSIRLESQPSGCTGAQRYGGPESASPTNSPDSPTAAPTPRATLMVALPLLRTINPSAAPTLLPTALPTTQPIQPTISPQSAPTPLPSMLVTAQPIQPTPPPTPTPAPSALITAQPIQPTINPQPAPTPVPSTLATSLPLPPTINLQPAPTPLFTTLVPSLPLQPTPTPTTMVVTSTLFQRTINPEPVQSQPPTSAPSSSPTINNCVDSEEAFQHRGKIRSCRWLARRPHQQRFLCMPGQIPHEICQATCKSCS